MFNNTASHVVILTVYMLLQGFIYVVVLIGGGLFLIILGLAICVLEIVQMLTRGLESLGVKR